MKKTILLSAFLVGSLLLYKPANAQFRVHVNINPRPSWGYNPYWHRRDEVVFYDHRGYRSDGYRDRRDWDSRYWRRNNDRYDNRRNDDRRNDEDRHGRDDRGRDRNHGDGDHRHDEHREHGGDRW